MYVRLADGEENAHGQHLPGQAAWIIGKQRREEERKYDVCNLPETTLLLRLVEVIKRRWACEQTHRELKQEVGLAHFEGRSWQGLHHHAVLCMVALTFLQWLRLTQPDDLRGETVPATSLSEMPHLHSVIQWALNIPNVQLGSLNQLDDQGSGARLARKGD